MSWFTGNRSRRAPDLDESYQASNNPKSRHGRAVPEPINRIGVRWGGQTVFINFKQQIPPTLADLKNQLSSVTSVPYDQMQIVSAGVLMKDDKAPLWRYKLRDGSRVTMVGKASNARPDRIPRKQSQQAGQQPRRPKKQTRPPQPEQDAPRPTAEFEAQQAAAAARKAAESDQSEQGILHRIQGAQHVAQVELLPDMEQLERSVASIETDGLEGVIARKELPPTSISLTGPNQNSDGLLNAHQIVFSQKKLSELLLRQLLSLDNVQVQSDELRQARKSAVREVQSMLDRVDAAWTKAKSLGVKPTM